MLSLSRTCLHCNFRYSIDQNAEGDVLFTIDVDSGLITTTRRLDREEVAWHNITVMASEIGMYDSEAWILSAFIDIFFYDGFWGKHREPIYQWNLYIESSILLELWTGNTLSRRNNWPWSLNHWYWPKQMYPWRRSVALLDWCWGCCWHADVALKVDRVNQFFFSFSYLFFSLFLSLLFFFFTDAYLSNYLSSTLFFTVVFS